jgi:hypothetical protein
VPTSLAVPASIPSGRSVVSRITNTSVPKAGGQLLHAAAIGEHDVGDLQQLPEIGIYERLHERDVGKMAQRSVLMAGKQD